MGSSPTSLRNFHRYRQIASLFVVNNENGRGMQNRGFNQRWEICYLETLVNVLGSLLHTATASCLDSLRKKALPEFGAVLN